MKTLVIYFSVGGVTKRIAEYMGYDSIAIIPAEPYTEKDLCEKSKSGRIREEQDFPLAEPEIAELEGVNWNEYNRVIIGYPIWNNKAPKVVSKTFMKNYYNELNNINRIDVFCTSGGGPITTELKNKYPELSWGDFRQFSYTSSKDEVRRWARR